MSLWQILILALIQGAAELLPVSSSAHVILAEKLMGLDPSAPELTFLLVMLHTGTMGAAILYFRKRWMERLRTAGRDFIFQIIVATGFTGFLGLGLKELIEKILEVYWGHPKGEIESLFKNLPMISVALFTVGVIILIAARFDRRQGEGGSTREKIDTKDSVVIGIVQAVCLPFRGFSRSGATISAALMRGLSRETAEEFSFALSVVLTPPVIALQLFRLLRHASDTQPALSMGALLLPGVTGMVFAFFSGLLALKLLSAWLEGGKWRYFGYYCLGASVVMAVAAASGL
jgi:undecaprenyl-diphosphatase